MKHRYGELALMACPALLPARLDSGTRPGVAAAARGDQHTRTGAAFAAVRVSPGARRAASDSLGTLAPARTQHLRDDRGQPVEGRHGRVAPVARVSRVCRVGAVSALGRPRPRRGWPTDAVPARPRDPHPRVGLHPHPRTRIPRTSSPRPHLKRRCLTVRSLCRSTAQTHIRVTRPNGASHSRAATCSPVRERLALTAR